MRTHAPDRDRPEIPGGRTGLVIVSWWVLGGAGFLLTAAVVGAVMAACAQRPVADRPDRTVTAEAEAVSAEERPVPPPWEGRDFFRPPETLEAPAASGPAAAPSTPARPWGQNYKLVGMMVDARPVAVIETRGAGGPGTQFLAVGDSLDGAVLATVDLDGAVFSVQGQTQRLRFEAGDH